MAPHTGNKYYAKWAEGDIEYLWFECTVIEDTFGTNRPPLIRVRILGEEDKLPLPFGPSEMDIEKSAQDKVDDWKGKIVTLHWRRDTRSPLSCNGPYELQFMFLGREGYPKGRDDWETNLW